MQINVVNSPLAAVTFGIRPGQSALILMLEGKGTTKPDAAGITLKESQIAWLPGRSADRIVLAASSRGLVMMLPDAQINQTLPAGIPGEDLRYLLDREFLVDIAGTDLRQKIYGYIDTIRTELHDRKHGAPLVVTHLMSLVFLQLWRMLQTNTLTGQVVPRSIAERFMRLHRLNRAKHWGVTDYAEAIGVSRDRLGSAVRKATGVSPQTFIHREIINEAKDLLENSGLQVAEIAFRLGYGDPAYFNRFFTRQMGLTPGRYRKQNRRPAIVEDESFAAWP